MNIQLTRRAGVIATVAAAVLAAGVVVALPAGGDSKAQFASVKRATAPYHNVSKATAAGFGELRDAAGIACIVDPQGSGAMGIHYVNGDRVGDPREIAEQPELLIYEPQANGRLKLVAVEYVVLRSDWTSAGNMDPPSLFGREFSLVPEGNRYGLPDFYELHVWLWEDNPNGTFADYNPEVSCDAA